MKNQNINNQITIIIIIVLVIIIQIFVTKFYTNTKEYSIRALIRNLSIALSISF